MHLNMHYINNLFKHHMTNPNMCFHNVLCTLYHTGVNYYQSVIPFLAAVQTGVIGDGVTKITIQPAEGAEDYCTSYTDCSTKHADLMALWETFFQVRHTLTIVFR